MKKTKLFASLSLILCVVLIAASALTLTGCTPEGGTPIPESPMTESIDGSPATAAPTGEATVTPDKDGPTVMGEGATVFYFHVVDKDGVETKFEIHTDRTIVGDALLELGLLEGEEGPYGLYVKKVNGITADYDTDGTYWAFYIGEDYGMTGVDLTEIEAGATYAFKVSK